MQNATTHITKPQIKTAEPISGFPLNDKRPKVRLPGDGYLLSDFARQVGAILSTKDIFCRGGLVFSINERGDGLCLMTPDRLRTWIENFLVCFKVKKIEGSEGTIEFKRTVTHTDAAGILASPQFLEQLQPIERFNPVRMPVTRADGWIELLPEGYDPHTKSFTPYDSTAVISGMPVDQAREILNDLLCEFGFADSQRSKAVAIAAMLTVFGAGLLPPKALRPCFVVVANCEGAGKTLVIKCATVPVLGYAPVGTKPRDEDEMKKILLASVLEAKPVIFFDNIKGHVASEALEGFLTCQDYEGRILGVSKTFRGENNATVFISGNGATVSPDMRRRSLFCELFLEVERAEEKQYRTLLETQELLNRRTDILSALLAIIKDWEKSMMPKPSRVNSSFPEWCMTIGAIVEHAGFGCPVEPAHIAAAADVDGEDVRSLVKAIADGALRRSLTFDELATVAISEGLFERLIPSNGELDIKSRAALAKILKTYDRRLIAEYRFTLQGKGHKRRYEVEKVK